MKSRIVTAALLALVALSLSACVGRVKSGGDTFVDTKPAPVQAQPTVAATDKTR